MEFETNKPTSDEDRRLAEAKKLILQPLHADIVPDAPQDSELAARHLTEPPIGNMLNDTEESTTRILPTKSLLNTRLFPKSQTEKVLVGLIASIIVFSGLAIFALTK